MIDLSIVIPCFNEEATLPLLWDEFRNIRASMAGISFEFIFVDDGSQDNTRTVLKGLHDTDPVVRYLFLSRNFGKEAALLAGLEASRGSMVATLDADLQDPPSLLPAMFQAVKSGTCDCAAARRVSRRGESALRSFFARRFYKLMARISEVHMADGERDFRLMSRKMTDAVLSLKEYNRFSKGIYSWIGFRTRWFEYEHVPRVAGKTKWSFFRLFHYSLDGIMAFSTLPLVFASVAGIGCFLVAFVMILVVIIKTLLWGDPVAGYPSLMSVILFIGGIQLFSIGIVGQYVAKIYLEAKKRPLYILGEKSDEKKQD